MTQNEAWEMRLVSVRTLDEEAFNEPIDVYSNGRVDFLNGGEAQLTQRRALFLSQIINAWVRTDSLRRNGSQLTITDDVCGRCLELEFYSYHTGDYETLILWFDEPKDEYGNSTIGQSILNQIGRFIYDAQQAQNN